MRGLAITGLCLAGAAAVLATWNWQHGGPELPLPPGPHRRAAMKRDTERATVEDVGRIAGMPGAAVHVAAHDPVRATCWLDGSVTIRRGETVSRILPTGDGERFRRVAVPADGTVFALSTRGRLYDLSKSPPRRLAVKGIQAGANIAAGGESDDLWIGGESGALIHVRRPAESVESDDQGDPSITSLTVGPGKEPVITVRRTDGTATEFTERGRGEAKTDLQPNAVAVVELRGIWGVVLASREVVTYRSKPTGTDGAEKQVTLDAAPHAACAIEDGTALLIATDAGERIVRFAR